MANRRYHRFISLVVFFLLILAACNMPGQATPTEDPGVIHTIAAQTVQAQMTLNADGGEQPATVEPQPSATQPADQPIPTATNTQAVAPENPPAASNTPAPSPTVTQIPCDQMQFVDDVTIEDGTDLEPGEAFTKTWRVKNTGSCTWTSGYSLVFDSGDAMGAPAAIQLTTGTVAPNQELDISVNLVAPDEAGEYKGFFRLRNPGGVIFGFGSDSEAFWVAIDVPEKTGLLFDFLAQAKHAAWGSGTTPINFATPGHTVLTYGGPDSDANGFAMIQDGQTLETGAPSAKVLETHPKWLVDGYIVGRYPEYKVGSGDHIKGRIGFLAQYDGTCGVGNATFAIYYTVGNDLGTLTSLGSWDESCDGTLEELDINLTPIKGKTVRFYLVVLADGDSAQDWAIWSSLGIFR